MGEGIITRRGGETVITGQSIITGILAGTVNKFDTIYADILLEFTKLADPSILPTNTGVFAAFSPDGVYLSVAHSTTPFVTIYKRNGDVFTKLADPDILPTGTGYGTAFSPDGLYLSVAHVITPFVTIYKRNGDVFTKLADPDILPTGTGYGTSFSPDGLYLTVAHFMSPRITIYKSTILTTTIYSALNSATTILDGLGYAKQAGTMGQTIDMVKIFG